MTMRRFFLLVAGVAVCAASACASSSSPSASGDSSSSPVPGLSPAVTSPASPAAPPSGGVDPGLPIETPPDMKSPGAGTVPALTITGEVTAGVEPGCRLISAEGGQAYLLIGGEDARVGSRVTVTGVPEEGMMSTCQQGVPLRVTSVKAAG